MVSLGCPKALVDSERILTKLRQEGYGVTGAYAEADTVIVNTCGFLDSAREESLEAIGEALAANGRVVVTGCLGAEADLVRARFPGVAAVTGAHAYGDVLDAVRRISPPPVDFSRDVAPDFGAGGLKLTPKHYAYLKISEGCDHRCSFCIIPQMRGDLASRPVGDVLREAEALAASGVRELLVVAQDTSAYGLDVRYASDTWRGREWRTNLEDLCRGLGELGVWVRLHYVYPYPHVDSVIPLMAEGKILPYLDIPFQHAAPNVLRAMKRPANESKTLERLAKWRAICPELVVRSTFVVGFPGETEDDFQHLLDWLEEAQLDRVGCFKYENVEGAPARDLPDHVPEEVKQERWDRFMAAAGAISAAKLQRRVGRTMDVLVDEVRRDGTAVARSKADAPEIDGSVYVRPGGRLKPGDRVEVRVEKADAYDLWAVPTDPALLAPVKTALRPGMRRVIARV